MIASLRTLVPAMCLLSACWAVAEDETTVRGWLTPEVGIVSRQQVILHIEVATSGFFSGGTRIAEFDVPGAMVLRREHLAINSTRRVGGVTWAVQEWKVAVYPQRAGRFEIPSIAVRTTTGAAAARTTTRLLTPPLSFDARLPAELADVAAWIAVPELNVTDRWDRSADATASNMAVGDSVTREVRISATDAAAMMLPEMTFAAPSDVAVYAEPLTLTNSVNRGSYRAERIERVTYCIERPGVYDLPPIDVAWWDTTADRSRQISLPERRLSTLAAGAVAEPTTPVEEAVVQTTRPRLRAAVATAVAALTSYLLMRRMRAGVRAEPGRDLAHAARRDDAPALVRALYRTVDRTVEVPATLRARALDHPELAGALDIVMAAAYGRSDGLEAPSRGTLRTAARIARLPIPNRRAPQTGPTLNPTGSNR